MTPRTIRYYEELGLLPRVEREQGKHRVYDETDVERLRELTRLRDLLGLSLDELRAARRAEEARADVRQPLRTRPTRDEERRALLDAALPHVDTQLELVRRRLGELQGLEHDLMERRALVERRRSELS